MSWFDGITEAPSPNFDTRALPVSMIVLHYTGMVSGALERLRDPDARVSSHYLVEEDGRVFRLVNEADRAWHAGKSRWHDITDINSASVGIEIANPGHEHGYRPFPRVQMARVVRLVQAISARHRIDRAMVVGHSDIAPTRKDDPGELFDWPLLARHRLALARPDRLLVDPLWPDAAFYLSLERFGYDVTDPVAATRAFQRRFRPAFFDGAVDGETRAILFTLLAEEASRLNANS
ncbi:N-acetylmuramoyl-L-alanine amidase [Sandaracinobacteroides saxicola]|uniref:N-acetylmuramoyl-L-alanine amidase n=1 Tax=Sandaracinobacteroides saxicola TaxID=2759707 RepID=A0A7G5IJJ0_9SPHN|nr:N-acetylmuramoyl-L-alanine amidase [Sandaracinobacteroides saxicola]QMW23532.1 N-acetylmuramoyl-L-alanine amidase [Sandaracinobacteroides saxicola]